MNQILDVLNVNTWTDKTEKNKKALSAVGWLFQEKMKKDMF